MKKTLHILFAALAATAALAGCTKEITSPSFEKDKVNSEGSRVIAVSFASQTKTILDGFQPKFANKDSILISNGEALDTCEVKVDGKGATITTNLTGPLTAVYPYTAAKMNESNLNQIDTVLVSTVQSGKFADANICMAKMTKIDEDNLTFINKTAVLRFYVDGSIGVKSIEISSSENIAGEGTGQDTTITVDAGELNTLDKVADGPDKRICYVAVKSGVNARSLKFSSVTATQGDSPVVKSPSADITLEAGKMYNAFIPYYIKVKVGDNPEDYQRWGYCNVGAFLPEEPGDYFAWGEIQGRKIDDGLNTFKDGHVFSWETCPFNGNNSTYNEASLSAVKDKECPSGILAEKNDAAAVNWGGDWRMPTKAEFDKLISSNGVAPSGFMNEVLSINGTALRFLAAGSGNGKNLASAGSYGRYWTLSLNTENRDKAFYFKFSNTEVCTADDYRFLGQSIRPFYGDLVLPEEEQDLVNVSEGERANCYIVKGNGLYCFDATVKGCSSESVGAASSASVVWKSFGTDKTPADGDLVYNVQLKDNLIYFNATDQKGNAVVAVKDENGNILWSWHIWLADAPADQVYANNAGTMMDRNLGATSTSGAGALGLLYQWGRKDPFPSSSSVSTSTQAASTIFSWSYKNAPQTPEWSVSNPDTFIKGTSVSNSDWTTQNDNLWASSKTKYDPCPAGYRVPDGGDAGVWSKAGFGDTASRGLWNYGYNFDVLEGDGTVWYPSAGYIYYEDAAFGHASSYGGYWSCAPRGFQAYCLTFGSNYVNCSDNHPRADAQSVRCLKIQD